MTPKKVAAMKYKLYHLSDNISLKTTAILDIIQFKGNDNERLRCWKFLSSFEYDKVAKCQIKLKMEMAELQNAKGNSVVYSKHHQDIRNDSKGNENKVQLHLIVYTNRG